MHFTWSPLFTCGTHWKKLFSVIFFVFVIILLFMEWRYQSISRFKGTVTGRRPIGIAMALYLLCLVTATPCYDPVSAFFKSIYVYYFKSMIHVEYQPGLYPLQQQGNANFNSFSYSKKDKPSYFSNYCRVA